MNCGMSMVKYILFVFNLLCALCGILVIVLGALLFSNVHSLGDMKEQAVAVSFPIALVVLGALIFIIAFFGCCGAIRESECMSMTYATLLFVLLVLDIALIALIFTTTTSQREIASAIAAEALRTYKQNMDPSSAMSFIEKEWKCCGSTGVYDYASLIIPKSCCAPDTSICTIANSYGVGCGKALGDWVTKYASIIAYVAIGIVGVELVGVIFACCLANHIRNHRRRSTY